MSSLKHLLEQAHPVVTLEDSPNLRLAELAPDMARLLIDMADHLDKTRNWVIANMGNPNDMDALLARFAALDEKAGGER